MANELDLRPFKKIVDNGKIDSHWEAQYYDMEADEYKTFGLGVDRLDLMRAIVESGMDILPKDAAIRIIKKSINYQNKKLTFDDVQVGQFFTLKVQFLSPNLWFKGKNDCIALSTSLNINTHSEMKEFEIANIYQIDKFIY